MNYLWNKTWKFTVISRCTICHLCIHLNLEEDAWCTGNDFSSIILSTGGNLYRGLKNTKPRTFKVSVSNFYDCVGMCPKFWLWVWRFIIFYHPWFALQKFLIKKLLIIMLHDFMLLISEHRFPRQTCQM